eukprot:g6173.t1
MTVKDLKRELLQLGIEHIDCIDRMDLAHKLDQHRTAMRNAKRNSNVTAAQSRAQRRTMHATQRTSLQLLSSAEYRALEAKWGAAFRQVEDNAAEVYSSLDSIEADGQLDRKEFNAALGVMGAGDGKLADFMFDAIDTDRSGKVSFFEFLQWMLTMLHGSAEEKLRFGFNMIDLDKNGSVSREEVLQLLQSMMRVLSGLQLHGNTESELRAFVESLFAALDINGDGHITWEEYRRGCLLQENMHALRALSLEDAPAPGSASAASAAARAAQAARGGSGERDDAEAGKEGPASASRSAQMGTTLFFGQRRFSFMLSVMVGLQVAVEAGTAATAGGASAARRRATRGASFSGRRGGGGSSRATRGASFSGSRGGGGSSKRGGGSSIARAASDDGDSDTGGDDEFGVGKTKFELPCDADGMRVMFTAYGVELFRDIRAAVGVSDETFLRSLGMRQVMGALLMGDIAGLSEMVSEGKSGSLFYWSHDGLFLVKTVNENESLALRRMAPRYLAHVRAHPDTLLTRLLGAYKMRVIGGRGKRRRDEIFYLVVMQSVFRTPCTVHERFDLKGSRYGRSIGEKLRGTKGMVHKDMDWVAMGRRLRLGPELAAALRGQIEADARFLAGEQIIDYSLLVGVHYTGRRKPAAWKMERMNELRACFEAFQRVCERQGAGAGVRAGASAGAGSGGGGPGASAGTEAPKNGTLFGELDFDAFCEWAYENTGAAAAGEGDVGGESDGGGEGGDDVGGGGGAAARAAGKPVERETPAAAERRLQRRQSRRGQLFFCHRGGIETVAEGDERECIVFVGIIDTLIPFKLFKKSEHVAKSLILGKGAQFSVVPPNEYMQRFVQFMSTQVIVDVGEGKEKEEEIASQHTALPLHSLA